MSDVRETRSLRHCQRIRDEKCPRSRITIAVVTAGTHRHAITREEVAPLVDFPLRVQREKERKDFHEKLACTPSSVARLQVHPALQLSLAASSFIYAHRDTPSS